MDSGNKRHGIDHNELTQVLRLVDYQGTSGSENALESLETLPRLQNHGLCNTNRQSYLHSCSGS